MRETYFRCISSASTDSVIRPNQSFANLALLFGLDDLCIAHCKRIENGMKMYYLIFVDDLNHISYFIAIFLSYSLIVNVYEELEHQGNQQKLHSSF